MVARSVTASLVALTLSAPALAAESVAGPVEGVVSRIIDGDTFEFVAHAWLGLQVTAHVRVRGIDTPEVRGACQQEKVLAAEATGRLGALLARGAALRNVADDKYFGRVVADVIDAGGMDVGTAMIESGLARPYDGRARQPWCPAEPR